MRIPLGFATMMRFGIVPISLLLLPMLAFAQPQRPLDLPPLPSSPPVPLRSAAQEYKELLPGLIEALKDDDSEVRQFAALALAAIGREALPALMEALKDTNKEERSAAAYAIGRIGPQARESIPLLVKTLKDPEPMVKRSAAEALSRVLGPDYNQISIESPAFGVRMGPAMAPPMADVPGKLPTPEPKPGTPK
ncbi:MAG TPA: HEAT repeat domain-containing protein [Gemmataceae bacterium]|nr:HEAT repeat domain-containing protein [Gemmataceae bacterium]